MASKSIISETYVLDFEFLDPSLNLSIASNHQEMIFKAAT